MRFNYSRKKCIIYILSSISLGFFNISMEDIKSVWIMEGSVVNDKWTLDHFHLNPEIGKMQVWFSDMFNGNQELSKYKQFLQNILRLKMHLRLSDTHISIFPRKIRIYFPS